MLNAPSNWFMEFVTPDNIQQFSIKNILYCGRSKYQRVELLESTLYGRCLILDGKVQSCEADEFIYHEALIHPAMILHHRPETVFIAGGGEGATLREILAHRTVKKVVMVDIDEEVIELCKKFLPHHHRGSFDDPRVVLLHMDARRYLEETDEKFDVIIMDLPEPIEGGPAYLLYTQRFYEMIRLRLGENGTFVTQSGAAICGITRVFTAVVNTLNRVFPIVVPYQATVPSFGGPWAFVLACKTTDPRMLSVEEIDRRIEDRVAASLRFYDGITHRGLFFVPKYLRDAVAAETHVITEDSPVFIPGY